MTTATRPLTFYASAVVWTGAAMLFLLPAIAMRVTPEVSWTPLDFAAWGAMLLAAGGGFEFLSRRAPNWTYRAAAAVALSAAFLLVWISLAVGIIGSEADDANLMFAAVPAVAIGGACLARFGADGMARAMLAAAAVQVFIAIVALALSLGTGGPVWPWDVIGVTAFLTMLWLASAWLFRRAA